MQCPILLEAFECFVYVLNGTKSLRAARNRFIPLRSLFSLDTKHEVSKARTSEHLYHNLEILQCSV